MSKMDAYVKFLGQLNKLIEFLLIVFFFGTSERYRPEK